MTSTSEHQGHPAVDQTWEEPPYDPDYDQAPPPDEELPPPPEDTDYADRAPWPPTADPARIRPETLAGLDEGQAQAVSTLTGPLLVVAGPGSGKTRVLTRRLAALVDAGVPPWRLLAVTFTNKAAAEMRERVTDLVGPAAAQAATVSTFHSLCARLLRIHHEAAGLPRSFTILDSTEASRVVASAAEATGHLSGLTGPARTQFVKETASAISRAKNHNDTPARLMSSPKPAQRDLGVMWEAYQVRLASMGAVDFDDLLLKVAHLLDTNPDVAAALRRRWWFVSVDEFQDTNAVQEHIVEQLVAEHRNICVVGDADQSIYAFRGAQPAVVRAFTERFTDATTVVLDANYRSTAAICAVSKAVIDPVPALFRSSQHTPRQGGEPVLVTGYPGDREEARAVVDKIVDRGGSYGDHAVLVRTNALSAPLEQALTAAGVPYDVVGATKFFERAEVKDAIAWLRLVANPADRVAFGRAITAPKRGIGDATIAQLVALANAEQLPIVEAARLFAGNSGAAAAKVATFVDILDTAKATIGAGGVAEGLKVVYDTGGLRESWAKQDAKEKTDRVANLEQLHSQAEEFDKDRAAEPPPAPDVETGEIDVNAATGDPLVDFLERAALVEVSDSAEAGDDTEVPAESRVHILTMHAAKGTEFPHVYVIGLEERILPHARALEAAAATGREDEMDEERRLFFVACSRAQETLHLSWCASRMRFGKVEPSVMSSFVRELPDDVVTHHDLPIVARTGSWNSPGRGPGRYGGHGSSWGQRSVRPAAGTGGTPRRAATRPAGPRPRVRGRGPGAAALPVGTRVRHEMFGAGVVVVSKTVEDVVEVQFDSVGLKTLSATLAPLTRIA